MVIIIIIIAFGPYSVLEHRLPTRDLQASLSSSSSSTSSSSLSSSSSSSSSPLAPTQYWSTGYLQEISRHHYHHHHHHQHHHHRYHLHHHHHHRLWPLLITGAQATYKRSPGIIIIIIIINIIIIVIIFIIIIIIAFGPYSVLEHRLPTRDLQASLSSSASSSSSSSSSLPLAPTGAYAAYKRSPGIIIIISIIPGPYCFHFNSGATIPNPAGPHVADRGTTPRYEG